MRNSHLVGIKDMSRPLPELFLSKGLLPENMPPVYTTRRLWKGFDSLGTAYGIRKDSTGDPVVYSVSKRGSQRRIFKIPHPAFVRDQAIFFEKHWDELSALILRSTGSASVPTFHKIGPRHTRITPHSELPSIRLKTLSRFRYCLVTDVSRFFPSVYTHSIPWAINGKSSAKRDTKHTSPAVYGNRLDFIIRQSQSRQTIGIAVGPDTSKIIAEILMSSVDEDFSKRSGRLPPVFVRHVDDYWIGGNTMEECDRHLQNLRISLRAYELDINESKTKIISTKYIFGDDWPFDIEKELLSKFAFGINNDPLPVLSRIVEHATTSDDDGIIRHVIRILDENHIWLRNWDVLEHFLAQCAIQFPHSFDYVARVIAWRKRRGLPIDDRLWVEVAETTILSHSSVGRDSETAWALWLLKEINIRLSKKLSDLIISNSSPLVLAFLAHFVPNKMATDRKLNVKLSEIVSDNPFSGSFWPLSLELVHLNHGKKEWSGSEPSPSLSMLHEQKLSIIDWSAPPKVFDDMETPDGGPDIGPDSALEDYGDDYGEFGVEEDGDAEYGDPPESRVDSPKFPDIDFGDFSDFPQIRPKQN